MDLHTIEPPLASAIFENAVLLVGGPKQATELRRQLTASRTDPQSPRDRLEAALDRIDHHLDDSDAGVPAAGTTEDDG